MPSVERVDRPNLRTRALPEPDCRGRAPEFDVGAGSDCGHLTVAENRERPSGRTIRIPVARLRAQSPNPKPDPIVFLAGGPGEFVSHVRTSSVALGLTSTGIEQRLVSGRRGGPVLVEAPDLIGVEQLAAEFKSRDVVNGYFGGQ